MQPQKTLCTMVLFLILLSYINNRLGAQIFMVADPNNSSAENGKSPYDGPPFQYFESSSQNYQIVNSEYNNFTDAVESAFSSWSNAAPVTFSLSGSSGVSLISEFKNPDSYGPAWMFPSVSGNIIDCSGSSITLNTAYQWRNDQQDLFGIPQILDVESMVVHEAGELLGIKHPVEGTYSDDSSAPTMAGGDASYFNTTLACRSLEDEDINAARFLQLRVPSLYSNISTAVNVANEIGVGYIYVTSGTHTLNNNLTIGNNINLTISSGVTINLNNKYIKSTGGTVIVEEGATINGSAAYLKSGSTIKGYFSNIQTACNNASTGYTVAIKDGTYNGIITFSGKNYLTITAESGTPTINGRFIIYSSQSLDISNLSCTGIGLSNCANPRIAIYTVGTGSGNGIYLYQSSYFDVTPNAYDFNNGLACSSSNGNVGSCDWGLLDNITGAYASSSNLYMGYTKLCGTSNYDLYAASGGYIYAEECYYDDGEPDTYGNVDVVGTQSCDGLLKASSDHAGNQQFEMANVRAIQDGAPWLQEYRNITTQYMELSKKVKKDIFEKQTFDKEKYDGEYKSVIDQYRNYIKKYYDNDLAKTAFTTVVHCFRQLGEPDAMLAFIREIQEEKKLSGLYGLAERYRMLYYQDKQDYPAALATADKALIDYKSDAALTCDILYAKGLMYAHDMDQKSNAAACFSTIVNNYPDQLLAEFATNELEVLNENAKQESNGQTNNAAADLKIDNYPNPFNPVTKISFTLPERDVVTLNVFDILGRQVAALLDGTYDAGIHTVDFDASNLPSGQYFYHLTTSKQTITKKMLVVK
jgi:tetratricopeptide (TPR) repeat protein